MALGSSDNITCLPLLTTIMLDKFDFLKFYETCTYKFVYCVYYYNYANPVLHCTFSLDGVNQLQDANNATSTEYQNIIQVVKMNLNLSMYFKAVCHRNVVLYTVCYRSTTVQWESTFTI